MNRILFLNIRFFHHWFCFGIPFLIALVRPSDTAYAHALHPESIDRHAELTLTPSRLVLMYEVVLGINPTERATRRLDANNDGTISDEERTNFVQESARNYAGGQVVRLGDRDLSLQYQVGDIYATIGHNGINVLRLDIAYTCNLPADIPREASMPFLYKDNNFTKFPGWKQMQFFARDDVRFAGFVPYTEYKPFDYEIINQTGFFPSTESIELTVNLPAKSVAENSPIRLPEKAVFISRNEMEKQLATNLLIGVVIILVVGVLVYGWWSRRSRS